MATSALAITLSLAVLALNACRGPADNLERKLRATEAGRLVPLADLMPPGAKSVCLRGPYEFLAKSATSRAERSLDEGSWALVSTMSDGTSQVSVHSRSAALDVMTASELHGQDPIGQGALVVSPCVSLQTGLAARFELKGRQYFTLVSWRD